jgi:hypothetical protein
MRSLLPSLRTSPFRIRSSDADDPDYEAKDQRYREHLRSLDLKPSSDLLKFFGWDFFHDGLISDFKLADDGQSLSVRFQAANIRKREEGGNRYLDPIGFTCEFTGLAHFHISASRLNRHNDPLDPRERDIQFMYAEVDTLTAELKQLERQYKVPSHSLIIETAPYRRGITLVFRQMEVMPDEPLAFEALMRDPSYEMPLWGRSL